MNTLSIGEIIQFLVFTALALLVLYRARGFAREWKNLKEDVRRFKVMKWYQNKLDEQTLKRFLDSAKQHNKPKDQ